MRSSAISMHLTNTKTVLTMWRKLKTIILKAYITFRTITMSPADKVSSNSLSALKESRACNTETNSHIQEASKMLITTSTFGEDFNEKDSWYGKSLLKNITPLQGRNRQIGLIH